MSNFLNSTFTDLNSLVSINSDEIRTNTLYVNGIQIVANSSNFSTINCSKLICQNDISSNTIYATTSIQNVPVAKFAFLDATSSIQTQFNNIPNIYPTKTQLTNNFNSFGLIMANTYVSKTTYNAFVTTTQNTFNNYALISSLSDYALLSQLNDYALVSQLSDYALITSLADYALISSLSDYTLLSQLSDYVLISSLSDYALISSLSDYALISSLSNYVTNSSLTTSLSNYVTNSSLTTSLSNYALISSLSNYVTNSSLTTSLSNYVTNSSLTTSLSNYVTNSSLTTSLSNYVLNSQLSNYCLQSNYTALKVQADATTLLLTGGSWDATYNFLNLAYNLHIYGALYIGPNNNLNVNSILTSLPSTYVSNTSLSSTLNSYATNSSVDNKVSNLQSQINSVKSQSDGNSAVIATNTTAIAGLVTASASQQTQITGLAATIGAVQGGLTTAEGQISTLQAKTSLQNVVGAYTQFTGGIKIMNGLVYSSIINNDGSSDFYALMTLRQGLAVTNGIQSDRVTTATELKSNGTLEVVGTSTLSTTNITGNLSITNGKLTINGTSSNTFNNDCIFNGNITATNLSLVNGLSLTELNCNNLKFTNSVGNNAMNIGTNGGSFLNPNSIYIGNNYSTTYLNGLVVFAGLTFNMSSFINQVGF
jgi:hypothetical protein